jgi:hypothetical protein
VVAFLGVAALSVIINLSRVEPGPVLVFLYGFVAPLGLYASVYRLWPAGGARSLSRLLLALGIVQLVVVLVVDLPRFVMHGHNPDLISGTFGTNAYQLVFFLLVVTGLLAGAFTFEGKTLAARLAPIMFVLVLLTVFLAQYRALLVTTVVTIVLVGSLLGARARGVFATAFVVVCFVVTLSYVSAHFPGLKFAGTVTTLVENPGSYVRQRVDAAANVLSVYTDEPFAIVAGTGPGTFSSRAWQTFADAGSASNSNVQGPYVAMLTGGRAYHTDVSDRYVLPQLKSGPIVEGSRALSSPFSSYLSLMAEVGLVGFVLMTGVYVAATTRALRMVREAIRTPALNDPLPGLLLGCTIAFTALLQMGFLENWLEVTRATFLAWILLAVATKELAARRGKG